ncbi:MAG: hypothetical protein QOH63_1935 [Acidobacteriota bacterium]|jgi:hypothetical protein|nr:hypothetical protein [Acidobacteriota bacterium]
MPLSPLDIKISVMKNGDNFVKLARKWKTTPGVISRVVNRREPFVYPEVRIKLAKYLDVSVSEVGRPFASIEDEERLTA